MLARAWESENDPRNTELGVVPDVAREMAVAAQHEYTQLRADLATAEAHAASEHETHDSLLLEVSSYRSGMIAAEERLATVTAEPKERASMGSLQDMAAKLNDAEYNLATVTEQRDAYRISLEEQHRTVDSAERELAETRKALEECSGRLTHAEGMSRVRLGALDSTRAELASWRSTAEKLETRVKELQRECDAWRQGCTAVTNG